MFFISFLAWKLDNNNCNVNIGDHKSENFRMSTLSSNSKEEYLDC